jgi:MarR family 2-MHQ and catechol resistance regulon transcriptional repressor
VVAVLARKCAGTAAILHDLERFMAESHTERKARALATYMSLARALHSLDMILDGQSESYGLSRSQFRVLEHLRLHGPMATGKLADRILFGDSTISVVTRNLQRSGLVVRRAHETDGRKAIVHLTREGKELIEEILPKRAKLLRAKLCVLGKREQQNLSHLCEKLAEGDEVKFVMEITAVDEDEG